MSRLGPHGHGRQQHVEEVDEDEDMGDLEHEQHEQHEHDEVSDDHGHASLTGHRGMPPSALAHSAVEASSSSRDDAHRYDESEHAQGLESTHGAHVREGLQVERDEELDDDEEEVEVD